MYSSLMWTLRAAFAMFVSGVAMLTLSIFMLMNEPSGSSSSPFVPGVFAKWVAVDLETGDVWAGSISGWTRAGEEPRQEALEILRGATHA